MSNLTLITGSEQFHRELESALRQAEAFSFCTPAIDSSCGKWPLWKLVEKHIDKLQRAFVALDGMRSEPYALGVLYRRNALRLIPAADGSFKANLWRIRHRRSVTVFTGAGDLCEPGMVAPANVLIKWSGLRADPFALRVERFLDEVSAVAGLPDRADLSDYVRSREACIRYWDEIHREGARYIQQDDPVPQVPTLTLVERTRQIDAGQREIIRAFSEAARVVAQRIRLPGGSEEREIFWIPSLSLWATFGRLESRHWNAFGVESPDSGRVHVAALEINIPASGINRRVQGALGVDDESGATYLLHRGKIRAQDGDGADLLQRRCRGRTHLRESDCEDLTPISVVGRLGAADFLRDLAAFVHTATHIRNSAR